VETREVREEILLGTHQDLAQYQQCNHVPAITSFPHISAKIPLVNTTTAKGVYLLCDGGYHQWREAICGFKIGLDRIEKLFGQ
jgi:hypothetical protein